VSHIQLDWPTEGAEWLGRVGTCLGESGSIAWTARSYSGTRSHPGIIFVPLREATCLWVVSRPKGLRAEVWGMGDRPDRAAVERWQQALNCGYERLRNSPVFEWTSVISNYWDGSLGDMHQRLAEDAQVGSLNLACSPEQYYEEIRIPGSVRSGPFLHLTWPIIVRGSSRGEDDWSIDAPARWAVRTLCIVLSIGWDSCWILLDYPNAGEGHSNPQVLRRSSIERGKAGPLAEWNDEHCALVKVLPWFDEAMERLAAQPKLMSAALIYYEGILISREHPSVALVCYTAAIEAIAGMHETLPTCPTCHSITGSTSRFRRALQRVLSDEDAKDLSESYSKRSKTVHAGLLHGKEVAFQSHPQRFHLPENEGTFGFQQRSLQQACRDLLLQELSGYTTAEESHRA
jgi:hypothetical protein